MHLRGHILLSHHMLGLDAHRVILLGILMSNHVLLSSYHLPSILFILPLSSSPDVALDNGDND